MRPKAYVITKSVRFTPEEWATVAAHLSGRKWSAFVRALLLDEDLPRPTTPVRRAMSAKDAKMVLILAGMANNLNQLARAANTAALRGQRIDVLTRLIEIQREVVRLK